MPTQVDVVCNGKHAVFYIASVKLECVCDECTAAPGPLMTPKEFEVRLLDFNHLVLCMRESEGCAPVFHDGRDLLACPDCFWLLASCHSLGQGFA